jgi:hypothetical protein
MWKFRASMDRFWDLKISIYVPHLMHISSEYFTSSMLPSLTSIVGRISLAYMYVITWINIASLALYIVRIVSSAACRATTNRSEARSCTGPSSSSLWLRASHYRVIRGRESVSDSAIEEPTYAALCTYYNDDLLPHTPLPLCSYWGHGQEFHNRLVDI